VEISIYENRIWRCQKALECELPTKPIIPLGAR
jgi:hypothetical protein